VDDQGRAYDPDPLPVGTRVRVRLSPECPVHWPRYRMLDGAIGRVVPDVAGHTDARRHALMVAFDADVPDPPGVSICCAALARAELERLA
jgi:hypothetical protein